eukprot:TRINITY_DN6888_c0_g1_i1.p1 TRINITY_DN6888_c0_g1~~TRINITY_DN6888_c0_g1_i1.p1  ORF type:complete len:352 (-),score=106.33 TRINITY_DN6888_c0_g1_i1:985-2040(-)
MCTMQNLRLGALTLCALRAISGLYLLILGSRLVANQHLVMAFGAGITSIGAVVILCSIFGVVAAVILNCGAVWHNKFLLLVYFLAEAALVLMQIASGLALHSHIAPEVPYAQQRACLLARSAAAPPTAACAAYARSERYARMLDVWRSYNYLSAGASRYYALVAHMEEDGDCCGFGAPTGCVPDPRAFPEAPTRGQLHWGGDYESDARYVCGAEPGWYGETYYCSQSVDESALEPVIGGCRFDYPLGECKNQPVIDGTSSGCGAEVDAAMARRITGDARAIVALGFVYAAGLAIAVCLAAKRPALDVLPDHVEGVFARRRDAYGASGKARAGGPEAVLARLLGKPGEALKR